MPSPRYAPQSPDDCTVQRRHSEISAPTCKLRTVTGRSDAARLRCRQMSVYPVSCSNFQVFGKELLFKLLVPVVHALQLLHLRVRIEDDFALDLVLLDHLERFRPMLKPADGKDIIPRINIIAGNRI